MPRAREYVSANVVNGKIYAIGGKYTLYSPSDENQMYDPQTGEWTSKTPIPDPPGVHVSAVIGSKIYIISDNLTQIYDAETDTWSTGTPIQVVGGTAVAAATTGTFAPKRIYVIDGTTNWMFDPQTNSWSTAASPQDSASGAGVAMVNDQIYRIGGVSPSHDQLDECLRYTPADYSPTPLSPTPSPSKPEPSPTVWISATIIASAAVVSFGLVAYLLRRKRSDEE
jgi:N-acetylneuraminic acid mutarotase